MATLEWLHLMVLLKHSLDPGGCICPTAIRYESNQQMNSFEYLLKVRDALMRAGWFGDRSPAVLLTSWKSFVDYCEEGYVGNIYEYFDAIRVREQIEVILTAPELQNYDQLNEYKRYVHIVDEQFKTLLRLDISIPQRKYWWEKGVLKYGGEEFAKDLFDNFDISIEVIK